MNKLKVGLLVALIVTSTGCSTVNSYWEVEAPPLVFTGIPKCAIALDSRKTYWSSIVGNNLYLFDEVSGKKCLFKVIKS